MTTSTQKPHSVPQKTLSHPLNFGNSFNENSLSSAVYIGHVVESQTSPLLGSSLTSVARSTFQKYSYDSCCSSSVTTVGSVGPNGSRNGFWNRRRCSESSFDTLDTEQIAARSESGKKSLLKRLRARLPSVPTSSFSSVKKIFTTERAPERGAADACSKESNESPQYQQSPRAVPGIVITSLQSPSESWNDDHEDNDVGNTLPLHEKDNILSSGRDVVSYRSPTDESQPMSFPKSSPMRPLHLDTSYSNDNSSGGGTSFWLSCLCFPFLTIPTLADYLPTYLSIIVTNGKAAALGLLAAYVVLVILWAPMWVMSYILTEPGVYCGIVFLIFKTGRVVLRLIAFPGSSQRVYGEIETEFAKYAVRVLETVSNTLADTATCITSAKPSSQKSSNYFRNSSSNDANEGNKIVLNKRDFAPNWQTSLMYRDQVLGMISDVLNCLLNENGTGTPITASDNDDTSTNRTPFGNNRIVGDIGNLAGLTKQAHADGKTLQAILVRLMDDFKGLELHFGDFSPGVTGGILKVSEDAKSKARKMLMTTNELKDFLPVLKPTCASLSEDANDDEHDVSSNASTNSIPSTMDSIKSSLSSLQTMVDPPPHSSIFGLDVLRGCVLSRYLGASQMWVKRRSGGYVDAIHIPHNGHSRSRRAVLYCNPNAGFYEVATGISMVGDGTARKTVATFDESDNATNDGNCWTDFYLENGFDVYLFNYSGYGRSYGLGPLGCKSSTRSEAGGIVGRIYRISRALFLDFKPSPSTLKEDALSVANHITNTLGVEHIVIHGESIGGMAAASTGYNLSKQRLRSRSGDTFDLVSESQDDISLLICDRTFCNLEACAQRLVGSWAGPAIGILAPFWNTNVARDFLSTTFPKVVCTDAADAIIADSSSLKSGISLAKEITKGETFGVGSIWQAPLQYRMADFEGIGVQETSFGTDENTVVNCPVWPVDKIVSLKEAFHFSACVTRIAKYATEVKKRDKTQSLRGIMSSESNDGGEGVEVSALHHEQRTKYEDSSDEEDVNPTFLNSPRNDDRETLIEVWNILACCDGLCGAPLGFAVRNGYDCVVSWLCAAITYGSQRVASAAENRLKDSSAKNIVGSDLDPILDIDFDCRVDDFYKQEGSETMIHPISLPEVTQRLKKIYSSHCGGRDGSLRSINVELRFCIDMFDYLVARIRSKLVVSSALATFHFRDSHESNCTGSFINLHCGHNNMFLTTEKEKLRSVLKEVFGDNISTSDV